MKHKVKVTVLDKKLYPELQQQYCANPSSGVCPCYNVGDEFEFYRDDVRDDFWHMVTKTRTKPLVMLMPLQAVRNCRSAPRPGMRFRAISIPDCRAARL